MPVGTLNVNQAMVRDGVKPQLDWNISYPETVTDIVDIDPRSKVTTKKRTRVQMRVVGVAFQSGPTHLPCAFWARIGGGGNAWQSLFYGKYDAVNPDVPVFDEVVEANTEIDFAARGRTASGSWYSVRWSLDNTPTCMACKNGDAFPDVAPAYDQGSIESFLSGYVSDDNRAVLGPRDLIYLFECYSTTPGSRAFDLQDVVVVVTFHDVD
ncbi:MAG: hypothetical protein HKN82_15465 [Akkermansiaceae bacterium]|nr:hypothetical protein [Akkermansiaceae bacterium]NNM28916.1 hypothetical protein [Akkermansiaceae bacterium]